MRFLLVFAAFLSSTIAHAQAGCFAQKDFQCASKPGIVEGQAWHLDSTITLQNANSEPGAGWIHFVNGRNVTTTPSTGTYCAMNSTAGKLPVEFVRDGVAKIPATKSPLTVSEISWYVGTVFFEGKTQAGNTFGLVVYCADAATGKENTSLQAIQAHLDGILTPAN